MRAVGRRLATGELRDIVAVPTSTATERLAGALGIPLATLAVVPELGRDGLEALESAVAIELRAAHVVGSTYVDPADLGGQGVRSRGLPEAHSGPVRLVSIGTLDVATCGGTHVANTAEVEALALLGAERMRGGVRLTWVAGGRVRRRMAAHEARTAVLRRTLGAADGALLDAVDAQMARLAAAERSTTRTCFSTATGVGFSPRPFASSMRRRFKASRS